MTIQNYDAVVVGGGPGGCTTAILIAMRGHRVMLIERQEFPRHRIGESLLPSSVHIFSRMLGVRDRIINGGFMRKSGGEFRWGSDGEPWRFSFAQAGSAPGADYAFQVERSKFDMILRDRAREVGVNVRQPAEFRSLIREGDRVVGLHYADVDGEEREVRCKYVVDSTGRGSRMAPQVGTRHYADFFKNVCLFGYFRHNTPPELPNPGDILCEAFEEGWMWYIPLQPNLVSIGAVVSVEHAGAIGKDKEAAFRRYIASCPILSSRLTDSELVDESVCAEHSCAALETCQEGECHYGQLRVVKDYSYCTDRFWTPGLVLVGDSACFIDPVFSSGVHLAQYSGLCAARSINTRLAGELDDETVFVEFEKRYQREYQHFYKFLLGFYDMNKDAESYFWQARSVLGSEGDAAEAFIRLVSGASIDEHTEEDKRAILEGAGEAIEAYFREGESFTLDGAAGFAVDYQDRKRLEGVNLPLFKGGLVVSEDELAWREPRKVERALSRVMTTEKTRRAFHKAKPMLKRVRDRIKS